jgi:thioredoxin 2
MSDVMLDERGLVEACPNCRRLNRRVYSRLEAPARCGQCKKALPPPGVPVEIQRSADFDRLIAESSLPVVVDYWAPWCGPCRMVAPELEKVAAHMAGRALVVKVNTEVLRDLAQRFGIRSIPTMAVFGGGRELARTTGARPATDIEAFIEQAKTAPIA